MINVMVSSTKLKMMNNHRRTEEVKVRQPSKGQAEHEEPKIERKRVEGPGTED